MRRVADEQFGHLRERLLSGPGRLDVTVRRAAFANEPVPEALQKLTTKIVEGAYQVTADDIEAARAAGYSEDELFDLTVSAAVGSGLRRLAVVDRLLADESGPA